MIYLTRQEQRIVILMGVVILLGTGLLLVKRFQPGWVLQLSLGKPDFDTEKDQTPPRLKSDSSMQKQESEQSDANDTTTPVPQQEQEIQPDENKEKKPVPIEQPDHSDGTDANTKININTATREKLEALPGIGPVLAQRIIDYREKHSGFTNINELTAVNGVGDATLRKFRDQITVEERNGSE